MVFLDSMQFMNSSLEKLANNLEDYLHVKQELKDKSNLVTQLQGVYPSDYVDSFDKFNGTGLPPQVAFYNSCFKKEHISDADNTHAKNVWEAFSMKTMGDYHDLYIKTDVLLLVDIFKNFYSYVSETLFTRSNTLLFSSGFSVGCSLKTK